MHPSLSSDKKKRGYRSIQYRSVSSDIKTNKILATNQKLPAFQINRYHSINNSIKRNDKKVLPFYENNHSLNKSADFTPGFNLASSSQPYKRHTKHASTSFLNLQNPQNQINKSLKNSNYLETFQQLMQVQSVPSYSHRKIGPISMKIKAMKQKSHINRIVLPSIIQFQNSEFTALDNINLPIDYIDQSIIKLKKQLQSLPSQSQQIRHQLKEIQKIQQVQLQEFKDKFSSQIKKLYLKLSQNSVYQQNHIRIAKRQICQLWQYLPLYNKEFVQTHQRQLNLQKTIFQTSPFELRYQTKKQQLIDDQNLKQVQINKKVFFTADKQQNNSPKIDSQALFRQQNYDSNRQCYF